MPKKDPCKVFACRIQDCLDKNHYIEDRCLDALEDMRQCCLKFHKVSFCCEGIKLDRVYKERPSETQKGNEQTSVE
uniref:CSON009328 protein n=1 Tax=Culicoides sonorensis TaxID=179676 RepID=A0A336N2Y4_CULSO